MAFSYSLFVVLLLLFPGFCFWAGIRVGDRTDFATPAPERPNSTATLFLVVLGTIIGHLLGTALFALQSGWCGLTSLCFDVSYDPNVYKAVLNSQNTTTGMSELALEAWLFAILLVGLLGGITGYWLARRKTVTDRTDPIAFGWLSPAVQAVKIGDAFVVAYVLTKTNYEGLSVAYEGEVQHLALDEDQSVKLVILNEVDRFLVNVSKDGLQRIDVAASVIEQLHITSDEIANIAFEIFRAPKSHVDAVDAEIRAAATIRAKANLPATKTPDPMPAKATPRRKSATKTPKPEPVTPQKSNASVKKK